MNRNLLDVFWIGVPKPASPAQSWRRMRHAFGLPNRKQLQRLVQRTNGETAWDHATSLVITNEGDSKAVISLLERP